MNAMLIAKNVKLLILLHAHNAIAANFSTLVNVCLAVLLDIIMINQHLLVNNVIQLAIHVMELLKMTVLAVNLEAISSSKFNNNVTIRLCIQKN